jgi:anti-sigma regulatory factor (Ser/Thr protein kinase)
MEAEIRGKLNPEKIREIRTFVCGFLKESGLSDSVVDDIELVTSEMVTNVYKHSYRERDGDIIVRISVDDSKVQISIRDFGEKFDPKVLKKPDPEVLSDHGYGLLIASQIMDRIEYILSHERGVEVILTKFRR